ncbi:hypothetical protein DYY67_0299 [Candidatus Nitrosotalea sp. TS]|nr:hypothetical protein [Candidatus Nitrosotalea sp. TS]
MDSHIRQASKKAIVCILPTNRIANPVTGLGQKDIIEIFSNQFTTS